MKLAPDSLLYRKAENFLGKMLSVWSSGYKLLIPYHEWGVTPDKGSHCLGSHCTNVKAFVTGDKMFDWRNCTWSEALNHLIYSGSKDTDGSQVRGIRTALVSLIFTIQRSPWSLGWLLDFILILVTNAFYRRHISDCLCQALGREVLIGLVRSL